MSGCPLRCRRVSLTILIPHTPHKWKSASSLRTLFSPNFWNIKITLWLSLASQSFLYFFLVLKSRFRYYFHVKSTCSCSVTKSCLTLQPHGLQHTRHPSTSPRACSNSCPLSQWCHPAISSSAIPFSSCFLSFPATGCFPMCVIWIRWPRYWNFSFSISLSNEDSGLISFRMDWLDLLAVQGTLKSLPSTTVQKHQFFGIQPSLWSNSHICTWLLEKS